MNTHSFSFISSFKTVLLSALLVILSQNLYGQQKIVLQNNLHSKKTKELNLTYFVKATTKNETYNNCELGVLNDSTVTVHSRQWIGQIYQDTICYVPVSEFTQLEYDRMKDPKKLALPTVMAGLGGLGLLIGIPAAAVKGDEKSIGAGLIIFGTLEAVCLTILFVGNKKVRYDLVHKWSLEIK